MTLTVTYAYAKSFIQGRIATYKKDISICLTRDCHRSHAYMPGLMATVSLLELLSGLYVGKVKYIGLRGILEYAHKFLDGHQYTDDRIAVLYELFRNKIAHLSQPYGVFDSHDVAESCILRQHPRRWITWQINASDTKPSIQILPTPGTLTERPPWPIQYSHKCKVSLRRLSIDIPRSANATTGLLAHLRASSNGMTSLNKFMNNFYIDTFQKPTA
jgi:hypothetical protein